MYLNTKVRELDADSITRWLSGVAASEDNDMKSEGGEAAVLGIAPSLFHDGASVELLSPPPPHLFSLLFLYIYDRHSVSLTAIAFKND
ncbi:hypothetical protein EGR_09752 [Echinococcus granulosus]|uniref:Uncharacterized protein n=1 Tax=Echinococcus granulosus TaxID=6210 RepID=W6U2N6_ECHGR|nr:hypothetical protein EGR_09752 [Echinococcus granulosus]EUB55375.1 hypothetical protein EGR_09752 [Echinococcus granulosus]